MIYKEGDYVVTQSDYNNHIMIFYKGNFAYHASCTEKFTENELKGYLENYKKMINALENNENVKKVLQEEDE